MNVFEQAAVLNPECQSYETIGGVADWEDVAYAKAGLSKLQSEFVDVKYALHLNKLYSLACTWFDTAIAHWKLQGYGQPVDRAESRRRIINLGLMSALRTIDGEDNEQFLRAVSRLSLEFNLNPHVCGVCGGHQSIVIDPDTLRSSADFPDWIKNHVNAGGVVICPECSGAGKRPQSAKQRARIMDMAPETWRRHWEPVFQDITSHLARIEADAENIMRRRFGATYPP